VITITYLGQSITVRTEAQLLAAIALLTRKAA
jgi:hypothetical protein